MPQFDVLALGSALVEVTPQALGASLAEADEYQALPSGATANFCVALARLGVRVSLATRVGEDELGQWLLRKLCGFGVDTSLALTVAGQYTPVSFGWMDQGGAKTFYFYRFPGYCDPLAEFGRQPLTDQQLAGARLFDFSEATIRAEPLRTVSLDLARRARKLGVQVCYAVNYRANAWREATDEIVSVQREALALADIALMNREEAQLITGCADFAISELQELGPSLIAVTAGADGATIVSDGMVTHLPAIPVTVCYDIGAGDTFHAGLLAAHLRGLDAVTAGRFASWAAALRISRSADMNCLPTWEEVVKMLAEE
jgi:fructokinase